MFKEKHWRHMMCNVIKLKLPDTERRSRTIDLSVGDHCFWRSDVARCRKHSGRGRKNAHSVWNLVEWSAGILHLATKICITRNLLAWINIITESEWTELNPSELEVNPPIITLRRAVIFLKGIIQWSTHLEALRYFYFLTSKYAACHLTRTNLTFSLKTYTYNVAFKLNSNFSARVIYHGDCRWWLNLGCGVTILSLCLFISIIWCDLPT